MNPLYELSLEEKIGQLVWPFIDGRNIIYDITINKIKNDLKRFHFGGYIIFYSDIHKWRLLLTELQIISKIPLLISADLEMGTGMQFEGATYLPSNMAIGATGDMQNAYISGEITAKEARAMGVHLTYAPVVDINNNPDNPIINIRAYGDNKDIVSKMGVAFIKGCKAHGLLTTAKHFPGHGNTNIDSHISLPVIFSSYEELEHLELTPFKACIDSGVDAVMVGHIGVPSLDEKDIPASLSYKIVTELLRKKMNFKKLVIVDAMVMGGVREKYSPSQATVKAIQAGCDVILMPINYEETILSLVNAVKNREISTERLNESLDRIWAAKEKVGLLDDRFVDEDLFVETFSTPKYVDSSNKIAEDAITLVKNNNVLPIQPNISKILNITINEDEILHMDYWWKLELMKRQTIFSSITFGAEITDEDIMMAKEKGETADIIISPVFNVIKPHKGHIALNEKICNLFNEFLAMNKKVILVSFSNPYILKQIPDIDAYICTYANNKYSQIGAVKVIFGEIKANGKLPVEL